MLHNTCNWPLTTRRQDQGLSTNGKVLPELASPRPGTLLPPPAAAGLAKALEQEDGRFCVNIATCHLTR